MEGEEKEAGGGVGGLDLAREGKNGNATVAPVVVMNCLRENFIIYYVIM